MKGFLSRSRHSEEAGSSIIFSNMFKLEHFLTIEFYIHRLPDFLATIDCVTKYYTLNRSACDAKCCTYQLREPHQTRHLFMGRRNDNLMSRPVFPSGHKQRLCPACMCRRSVRNCTLPDLSSNIGRVVMGLSSCYGAGSCWLLLSFSYEPELGLQKLGFMVDAFIALIACIKFR